MQTLKQKKVKHTTIEYPKSVEYYGVFYSSNVYVKTDK